MFSLHNKIVKDSMSSPYSAIHVILLDMAEMSALCAQLYLALVRNKTKVLEFPYHISYHQNIKLKKLCLSCAKWGLADKTKHPEFAVLHTVQST
jgi:hypothetical protein